MSPAVRAALVMRTAGTLVKTVVMGKDKESQRGALVIAKVLEIAAGRKGARTLRKSEPETAQCLYRHLPLQPARLC